MNMYSNKFILVILFPLVFAACKKDGSKSSSGKLLLSKIITDGLLTNEFIYSIEGKLVRTNFYNTGSGLSKLSYHFMYEHNADGTRKQDIQYNGTMAIVKRVYTYNGAGKVSRIDVAVKNTTGDNIDDADYFEVFEYDNNGQLTKLTRKEMNQSIILRRQYSYDDEGRLVHSDLYVNDDDVMEIRENNVITPGDKQMPDQWKALLVEPEEWDLYQFSIEERTLTDYWLLPAGRVTNYKYQNRVRNTQGMITGETIQAIRNGVTVYTEDRNYEYVESKSFKP
jgi:YD repeat-containing protein